MKTLSVLLINIVYVSLLNVLTSATVLFWIKYNFARPRGVYPWKVNTGVWEKNWTFHSSFAPSSEYNFRWPFYDWISNIQNPTPIPDGLNPSKRVRGPDGEELPADVFGARITPNAKGLNIQKPFYRPTIENSTSLRMCSEYVRNKWRLAPGVMAVFVGVNAEPREFPHLALLGYGQPNNIEWACGGSLISNQYVLTAAHCISPNVLGNVSYVRLGELDVDNTADDEFARDFTVADTITHPLYNYISNYHDIALIRLNESITSFTAYINPACLATTRDLENVELTIAGWGRTEIGGPRASRLQKATLQLVTQDRCRSIYRTPRNLRDGIVEDVHICADGGTNKSDACSGDSGGPLQFTNNNFSNENISSFFEIAGVVSFGFSCGKIPGVYTRVLPYVKWIESIVWR